MIAKKIFTVQSHVSGGYAGNKASVFPMQLLGFEPTVINTVEFSNHTGYKDFTGMTFSTEHIENIFKTLHVNNLASNHVALFTGYLGKIEIGEVILKQIEILKLENPDFIYFCDPVFGDSNGCYTKPEIPIFFKEKVLYLADVITPNCFEMSFLSGIDIVNIKSALLACNIIYKKFNINTILLTSCNFSKDTTGMLVYNINESYFSTTKKLNISKVANGTGDITSAIFGCLFLKGISIDKILEHTISSLYAIVNNTFKYNKQEIALIESQNEITNPKMIISNIKLF